MDAEPFLARLIEALGFAFLQAVSADLASRLEVFDRDAVQVGGGLHALACSALDTHGHSAHEQDRGGHDQQAGQEPVAAVVREADEDDVAQGEDQGQRLDDQVVGHVDQHQADRIGVGDQTRKQVADRKTAEEAEVELLQLGEDVATHSLDDA